jgi:hypothetical protein
MAKCRIVTERSYTTPRIKFGSVIALDQPEFTFLRALPEYRLNRLLPTKIKSFADHVEVEIYHGSFVINNEFRYLQFNIATTRVVCRSCLLKRVQRANLESGSRHSQFIRRCKTSAHLRVHFIRSLCINTRRTATEYPLICLISEFRCDIYRCMHERDSIFIDLMRRLHGVELPNHED